MQNTEICDLFAIFMGKTKEYKFSKSDKFKTTGGFITEYAFQIQYTMGKILSLKYCSSVIFFTK